MVNRAHFLPLVERARSLPALRSAFVYPCDRHSLQLALSSAFAGTLAPVLVGPEIRIRDIAARAGIDIAQLPIEDTVDDPRSAARRAAHLARGGRVAALVKGSLGNDELLAAVAAPDSGLRGLRRLSHAYFLDLPGQPRGLLLADALINITPNIATKRDILENTIGLARALGFAAPRVALLGATDAVTPALPSTADAAALTALAAQGRFGNAIIDGPMTVDSALDEAAARVNGRESEVAGHADVLIAPNMEAAALVLRTLTGLTRGLAAGLVLGADLPIVTASATDSMEVRIASCVLAALMAAYLTEARKANGQAAASSRTAEFAAPALG